MDQVGLRVLNPAVELLGGVIPMLRDRFLNELGDEGDRFFS